MKAESCAYCDTVGPFNESEQAIRDMHRAWHELIRHFDRVFGPLVESIRRMGEEAAKARTQTDYRLAGPSEGDSK